MSIHWVAVGDDFEKTVSQGWTKTGDATVREEWYQWSYPEVSVSKASSPANNDRAQVEF